MSYTPNPLDPTAPLDSEKAGTAAAEFRALKTQIVAMVAVDAALDKRLDAIEAYTSPTELVALTGSGNFTVPAGVTTLWVRMRGGGRAAVRAYAYPASSAPFRWHLHVRPQPAEELVLKLAVTPGDVIAYAVGANDVVAATLTAGTGGSWAVAASTAAADTTFGAYTARKGTIAVFTDRGAQAPVPYATYEDTAEGSAYVPTFPVGTGPSGGGTSQELTASTLTNGKGAFLWVAY